VHSRAEIPSSFASEEEEREWWAMHELADELLPSEADVDQMTEQHHTLLRLLQSQDAEMHSQSSMAKPT